MLSYFNLYFIQRIYGPGYCLTELILVIGLVLLFAERKRGIQSLLLLSAEILSVFAAKVALSCLYYYLLGQQWLDFVVNAVLFLGYGLLHRRYSVLTRIVRIFIFYTITTLAPPISEPIGEIFWSFGESYRWGELFTPAVVAVIIFVSVWYLRKFSTEELRFAPSFPALLIVIISCIASILTIAAHAMNLGSYSRLLNTLLSLSFLALELLSYGLYHMVNTEYDAILEANAIRQKEDLERELMQVSRHNYEELHEMRHEIKNHMTYLNFLCNQGDFGGLKRYLQEATDATESLFQFVECGHDVINAVMNHSITQAKAHGVTVNPTIVVPPELPFQETDLCSLLSNLMDNAIEAACQSGVEAPTITVNIRPQHDYLFLRVTNPVDETVPQSRRLTLHTIKKNPEAHGYGTKIIRAIAERYHGSVKFDICDNCFVADVMLLLSEE